MTDLSPRRSKRRKLHRDPDLSGELALSAKRSTESTAEVTEYSVKKQKKQRLTCVRVPNLIRPRSMYRPQAEEQGTESFVVSERNTLNQLIVRATLFIKRETLLLIKIQSQSELEDSQKDGSIFTYELHNFCIYRVASSRTYTNSNDFIEKEESSLSNELVALQDLDTQEPHGWFADGVLHASRRRFQFQRVLCNNIRFSDSRGTRNHSAGDQVWIQSAVGLAHNVWYRLRNPTSDYIEYYNGFLWLIDLSKHIIDFLTYQKAERNTLYDFRHDGPFSRWLRRSHHGSIEVQRWMVLVDGIGYRSLIASNIRFLSDQITDAGLDTQWYFIKTEVDPRILTAVPQQEIMTDLTTVTPYVYQCFRHMPWADILSSQSPEAPDKSTVDVNNESLVSKPEVTVKIRSRNPLEAGDPVKIGDVVALASDQKTWKGEEPEWYAYVQDLQPSGRGIKMGLLWIYRPSDTPCQSMNYPYRRELFLGTHCNCGDEPVYSHEVLWKPAIRFFDKDDQSDYDFFIRQKYDESESAWTTLRRSDFLCQCKKRKSEIQYETGDTVLVKVDEDVLEPFEIIEPGDNLKHHRLNARKLLRMTTLDPQSQPNELLYTSAIVKIARNAISRPCRIRFFSPSETIPQPYCRHGTSDFFYIRQEITTDGAIQPISVPWPSIKQGLDTISEPLRGLDIFCGGGNLGRGLEEGGAVKFNHAVDYFSEAIHTYKANVNPKDQMCFYRGSVDDYLRQAIRGKRIGSVAQKGDVDFISAGSPCQGFSNANQNKGSKESLKNISMVASVVSFIDFYQPKYAVLENVTAMAMCGSGRDHKQNVFAQVLCALIGRGYQLRPLRLDAWSFGSPQSRTRLFILIAAPGLPPMMDPPPSHSHPNNVTAACLGRTPNGLPLGGRHWEPTPFDYVTIGDATKDLPLNDHGKLTSIRFSDHRMSRNIKTNYQIRIASIPKNPPRTGFVKAVREGWMPTKQCETFALHHKIRGSTLSKAWQRVDSDGLLPTVVTSCSPEDGISGTWVHWEANRLITIMEARRAQGFPDDEVIIGSPAAQWKIIGNSVARPVALALGMALRKACETPLAIDGGIFETSVPGILSPRRMRGAENDHPYVRYNPRTDPIAISAAGEALVPRLPLVPKINNSDHLSRVDPSVEHSSMRDHGHQDVSDGNPQRRSETRSSSSSSTFWESASEDPQKCDKAWRKITTSITRETTVSEVTVVRKTTKIREFA